MDGRHGDFDAFFDSVAPRLRVALAARYGPEIGGEAASEAMAYAWEHWGRLQSMPNPAGYLYRVGQSATRRLRPLRRVEVGGLAHSMPAVEPGLDAALLLLSPRQRTMVLLVKGFGWTLQEVAILTGVRPSTVQRHVDRALARLRTEMGVIDGTVH